MLRGIVSTGHLQNLFVILLQGHLCLAMTFAIFLGLATSAWLIKMGGIVKICQNITDNISRMIEDLLS